MARRRRSALAGEEVPGVGALERIASGGGSTVYRAWQPELDRWVAVKVLGLTLSDAGARDRFLRECSAIGRLTGHPNIVTVLASGTTRSDRPYLTMDLFERGSLADLLGTGPVAAEDALRLGVKLAGALETAHRVGVLHRDLKPENVLLSRYGEPGLADFGIATLGEARGATEAFTPTHAAPEVLDGKPATAAADVYGLGSTLWTALAGRLPFGDGADGPLKLMLRVLQEPLPAIGRPEVPAVVEDAVRWAMEKSPARRPATALELGERLRAVQVELGLPATEMVLPFDPSDAGSDGPRVGPRSGPSGPPPLSPAPPAGDLAAPTIRPARRSGGAAALPLPPLAAPVPAPASPALADAVDRDPAPATVARARPELELADAPPPARGTPSRTLVAAVIGSALILAVALVAGAIIATRERAGGRPPGTTTPGPTTSAPANPRRMAQKVTIAEVANLGYQVAWTAPEDAKDLTSYVLLSRAPTETASAPAVAVGPGQTVATLTGLPAGGRCVVVATLYAGETKALPSAPACT